MKESKTVTASICDLVKTDFNFRHLQNLQSARDNQEGNTAQIFHHLKKYHRELQGLFPWLIRRIIILMITR